MHALDVFVLVSGTFSILATVPLLYLAIRAHREARALRRMQDEVAAVVDEVRGVQHEMHHDQRETKQTVERVAHAAARRRRLPRIRFELEEPRQRR